MIIRPMSHAKLALSLALALTTLTAQAARPLATEDAGVLARSECVWECP